MHKKRLTTGICVCVIFLMQLFNFDRYRSKSHIFILFTHLVRYVILFLNDIIFSSDILSFLIYMLMIIMSSYYTPTLMIQLVLLTMKCITCVLFFKANKLSQTKHMIFKNIDIIIVLILI
jgi:hypothetical protein